MRIYILQMAEAQIQHADILHIIEEGELSTSGSEGDQASKITITRKGTGVTMDRLLVDISTRRRIQKYYNDSQPLGRCQVPQCLYQSNNGPAFYRHVETHNLLYICDCGYYSSVRDTTTRHVRRVHHHDASIRITQTDRHNWGAARKVIAGLPHRMPKLPAHSNDIHKLKWAHGATKLIDLADVRTKLTIHPSTTQVKTPPADPVIKPLIPLMAKPFRIDKLPCQSTPVPSRRLKIPHKEMSNQPTLTPTATLPYQPGRSLPEEIRRREQRTVKLKALLQAEEAEIRALERLQQKAETG